MKPRHRVALVAVLAALLILYGKDGLQPRWLWDSAYWLLLLVAFLVVIRWRPSRRTR